MAAQLRANLVFSLFQMLESPRSSADNPCRYKYSRERPHNEVFAHGRILAPCFAEVSPPEKKARPLSSVLLPLVFFVQTSFLLFSFPDDGKSTIVCREAFVVFGDATHLTQDLGLGKEISCSYSYVLTADDVISLERGAVGKVTASDPYDQPVEASDSKTVSLSQVNIYVDNIEHVKYCCR